MRRRIPDDLRPARGCLTGIVLAIAVDVLIVIAVLLWGIR